MTKIIFAIGYSLIVLLLADCSRADLIIDKIGVKYSKKNISISYRVTNDTDSDIYVYEEPPLSIFRAETEGVKKGIEIWQSVVPYESQQQIFLIGVFIAPKLKKLSSGKSANYKFFINLPIPYRWMYKTSEEPLNLAVDDIKFRIFFGYFKKEINYEDMGLSQINAEQIIYRSNWFLLK